VYLLGTKFAILASSPQHVSPSSSRRSSPSVIRQSVNESAAQMLPTRSPGPQTPQTPALPMTDSQLQAYSALYDPIDEVSSLYMPSSSHRSQQTGLSSFSEWSAV